MTKFCEHAHADRTFEIKLVGLFISFLAKAVESEKNGHYIETAMKFLKKISRS